MQENNLLNRNGTNDIQGVKSTYAYVILISSIETENQLSYCGSTLDLRETKQIIYHSKGFDKSCPKMHFLLNLSHFVKSYGHLCQILACLPCRLTKYGHVT